MIPGTVEALLADLRIAHDLYLETSGREIAEMARLGEKLGVADAIADDLEELRRVRAGQERNLRALERVHREAAA